MPPETVDELALSAEHISQDLKWLQKIITHRINLDFGRSDYENSDIPFSRYACDQLPSLQGDSPYFELIQRHSLGFPERIAMMLSLSPFIQPEMLDIFLTPDPSRLNRPNTQFGGVEGKKHRGFIPSGQTLLYILAGDSLAERFGYMALLESGSILMAEDILNLEGTEYNEPFISGTLQPTRNFIDLMTIGRSSKPVYSSSFPAREISTELDWDDLILSRETMNALEDIHRWIDLSNVLLNDWGMYKKIKPGFRSLFYGPPGTGKTLTAALLGKETNRPVYRIDLSKIVSKYIGETEKNMAQIFDRAENKGWILFFDEADALFSKRTGVQNSNDRHANQEVAYLLQRIEDYNGLIILATNMKSNIDNAFMRRFQSIIYFPIPKASERLRLWENAFPEQCIMDQQVDLGKIANEYEIAGGAIINIAQYCSLKALNKDDYSLSSSDINEGIQKELIKSGRTL